MGDCRIRIVIAKSLLRVPPEYPLTNCDVDASSERITSNKLSVSFVRMYSADTTIREVVDGNHALRNLFFGEDSSLPLSSSEGMNKEAKTVSQFTLWDCTLSPPKDITSYPRQEYPDLQGLKSKTLHAAGFFPSGTWVATPTGMTPNELSGNDGDMYVDVQYNSIHGNRDDDTHAIEGKEIHKRVEYKKNIFRGRENGSNKSSTPLPSQIMEAVSNRFDAEDREEKLKRIETSESSVADLRLENRQRRVQKERDRITKLERRIAMLEEQSQNKGIKKKKTSDQVLRMLVKSRATGDKNLKEQDRFYFQCLVLIDINPDSDNKIDEHSDRKTTQYHAIPSKEYRYFSPQDTFAKIVNSFSNGQVGKNMGLFSEVLFKRPGKQIDEPRTESSKYYRFPMTMRVYEAESHGHLTLSESITNYYEDTLIIRWYEHREDSTPLIQYRTIDDVDNSTKSTKKETSDQIESHTAMLASAITNTNSTSMATNSTATFEDSQLFDLIREIDLAGKKGTKKAISSKKASAAAVKVRQMKMKSKAKGNKKLKIEDRVFLEVVSIPQISKKPICEYIFLSRKDPIERILQFVGPSASSPTRSRENVAEMWDFLVPQEDARYRPIAATSILIQDAEEQGIIKSFDRIILRSKRKQV